MAAGFKSPFFLLGFSALAVSPAGFASPLFFLGLGGFEAQVESPPVEDPVDPPFIPEPSKRRLASPWWPTGGGFARGVYGWAHTRMGLLNIQDFYWAAQTLTLTGLIRSDQFSETISFSGSSTLPIQPYELLDYRARTVQTQPVGDGNYGVAVSYVFAGPLHWDGLDGTFCPEMTLHITISHNVSPDPPEVLGFVTIDPNVAGIERDSGGNPVSIGPAYLMDGFNYMKEMPLYYAGFGVLTQVAAEVTLRGTRWVFED